jgi:16S rRNA (uracil1498-N3)-methyltransferase
MLHLYVQESIQGELYYLTDAAQVHHLGDVLRARVGDPVSLFYPQGTEYIGNLVDIKKNKAIFRIESSRPYRDPGLLLTIACAVPKGSRMDDIVDELTQLGVDVIFPMLTERVVPKFDIDSPRPERWRKIALSASEQSRRNTLPGIPSLMTLDEVLISTMHYNLKLIPNLEEGRPISAVVPVDYKGAMVVLIGPEGDFSPVEIQKAKKAGFMPVSLGHNVLRVDTAASAVAAYIKLSRPQTDR